MLFVYNQNKKTFIGSLFMKETKVKQYQLEILRVVAILFVIYNHTRAHGFELYKYDNSFFNHYLSMAISIACKAAVPLFFMISGAVLLGKEESIADFLKKRVLRMIIVIAVFTLLQYIRLCIADSGRQFSLSDYFVYCYAGNVIETYWYLKAYLGFLFIVPFLRIIASKSKKEIMYYLLALKGIQLVLVVPAVIFGFYYPNVTVSFLSDVLFYPLIGYFINTSVMEGSLPDRINKKTTGAVYAAGLVFGVILYQFSFVKTGSWSDSGLNLLVPVLTLSIFTLVLLVNVKSEKVKRIFCVLGSTSFGIYLIEDVVRNVFEFRLKWNFDFPDHIISAVIFSVIVWITGVVIIYLVKKIPFVSKFI